jgi:hypothetical protein
MSSFRGGADINSAGENRISNVVGGFSKTSRSEQRQGSWNKLAICLLKSRTFLSKRTKHEIKRESVLRFSKHGF